MLDETVEELRAVALAADDASGHFPAMYARVTERIARSAADGTFADPEAMVRFARAFARWYLRPRAGTPPIPRCWQAGWDVADDGRLLIVQHLLLGMNAHINYDLAQVVVHLADERGGSHTDLQALRPDFDTVNDVLVTTMPDTLRDLGRVSRWVNLAAARGGGAAFGFSLRAARDQSWRTAVRLHALDDAARAADVAELDRLVSVLAHLVARPGRPASWLVPIGRRLETRDPRAVTRSLLGPLA